MMPQHLPAVLKLQTAVLLQTEPLPDTAQLRATAQS